MAQIRIMYWKGIPYGVRASDETGARVSRQLPPGFQEAVDAAAMAEGATSAEDYQAGFTWGPAEERPGTAFFSSFRDLTASGFWTSRMGIEDLGYVGNTATVWEGPPAEVLRKLGLEE